jgi:predicted outer membrane protein
MIPRLALAALTLLGLAACAEVSAPTGPPVAGTTPSTFSPARREAAEITQRSQGLSVR